MAERDEKNQVTEQRDYRAVAVALAGLTVVLLGGIVSILELPGPVPTGQVDTTGRNIVAIVSAAVSAVAAVVSAYFGIKAANTARGDSSKVAASISESAQRSEIRAAHFAAAEPTKLSDAAKAVGRGDPGAWPRWVMRSPRRSKLLRRGADLVVGLRRPSFSP